jgi:hypothetical protein
MPEVMNVFAAALLALAGFLSPSVVTLERSPEIRGLDGLRMGQRVEVWSEHDLLARGEIVWTKANAVSLRASSSRSGLRVKRAARRQSSLFVVVEDDGDQRYAQGRAID